MLNLSCPFPETKRLDTMFWVECTAEALSIITEYQKHSKKPLSPALSEMQFPADGTD